MHLNVLAAAHPIKVVEFPTLQTALAIGWAPMGLTCDPTIFTVKTHIFLPALVLSNVIFFCSGF